MFAIVPNPLLFQGVFVKLRQELVFPALATPFVIRIKAVFLIFLCKQCRSCACAFFRLKACFDLYNILISNILAKICDFFGFNHYLSFLLTIFKLQNNPFLFQYAKNSFASEVSSESFPFIRIGNLSQRISISPGFSRQNLVQKAIIALNCSGVILEEFMCNEISLLCFIVAPIVQDSRIYYRLLPYF